MVKQAILLLGALGLAVAAPVHAAPGDSALYTGGTAVYYQSVLGSQFNYAGDFEITAVVPGQGPGAAAGTPELTAPWAEVSWHYSGQACYWEGSLNAVTFSADQILAFSAPCVIAHYGYRSLNITFRPDPFSGSQASASAYSFGEDVGATTLCPAGQCLYTVPTAGHGLLETAGSESPALLSVDVCSSAGCRQDYQSGSDISVPAWWDMSQGLAVLGPQVPQVIS